MQCSLRTRLPGYIPINSLVLTALQGGRYFSREAVFTDGEQRWQGFQ